MRDGLEADADLVGRFVGFAWNRGDRPGAAAILGSGFKHHDLVTHADTDASGYLGAILNLRSAFASIEFQIREIFASDGRVASRWTAVGTHRSGADVKVDGLSIDHVIDGRIVENWTAWDVVGLRAQLPELLGEEDDR